MIARLFINSLCQFSEGMMRLQRSRTSIAATIISFALAGCGGGGGGVASMPTPPPTPTPPPETAALNFIIAAAVPDQPFATMGGIVRPDGNQIPVASTAAADQARLRYDSVSGQYQIQVPAGSSWEALFFNREAGNFYTQGPGSPYILFWQSRSSGYQYSALAALYQDPSAVGVYAAGNAFGIPTPVGAVPTTGSATYNGSIVGFSTETVSDFGAWSAANVEGSIALSFNFGAGTLAGTASPTIRFGTNSYALSPLTFTNTVYSTGSTTFSGTFDTNLAGANSFAGQFTGPAAQELIGSFLFPYTSHDNGNVYQATGAFVAKK